jgi:hypothetical protein
MMDPPPDGTANIRDEPNPYLLDDSNEHRAPKEHRSCRNRRTTGLVALGVCVGLAVGGWAGYALGSKPAPPLGPHPAAIGRESPAVGSGQYSVPLGQSGASGSAQASLPDSYSPLFTRQTAGIRIRAFLDGGSENVSGATQGCPTGPPLVAEVSTAKMVGVSVDWGASSSYLYPANAAVQADVLGAAEGQPIAVVVIATGPNVKEVTVTFSTSRGQSDSMSPVYGWAVLAAPIPSVPSPAGQVIGQVVTYGAQHQTLAAFPLQANGPVVAWYGYAPSCVLAASPSPSPQKG